MAWNPSPKVARARDIAKSTGSDQVVLLLISRKKGTIEMATYGETRGLCADARKLGDAAYDAVYRAIWETG